MVKRSLVHVVLGLGALALGCGGSETGGGGGTSGGSGAGGGAAGTNPTLSIVETTPSNDDTDIERSTMISAQFDAMLADSTVNAMSFAVRGGDGVPVLGSVAVDMTGLTVTFTPDESLARMSNHTVTLTTEIESLEGARLASDYSWSFTTRDGAWGAPVPIEEDDAASGADPRVAVNSLGNAMVVWRHGTGVGARRYVLSMGWDGRRIVHAQGSAFPPEVAMAAERNSVAVWNETEGGRSSVLASHHTPESLINPRSGWRDAELLELNDGSNTREPHVAMHSNGNATAVWAQPDGAYDSIWANRYTTTNGWMGRELVEHSNVGHGGNPRVALDSAENAVVVWIQYDGGRPDVWANRFTQQGGWGSAAPIEAEDGDVFGRPEIAVDEAGNATAVWSQFRAGRYRILSNRFASGAGWGTAAPIEAKEEGDAFSPQIGVDLQGNPVAVWTQEGNVHRDVFANRFTVETGWGTPVMLETNDAGGATATSVAVDPSGNAIVIWIQHDGAHHNLWANRYTHGGGWLGAELLEAHDVDAIALHVAVGPRGNAVAVWSEVGGPNNVWAVHFE